jgi:hypothetical protein
VAGGEKCGRSSLKLAGRKVPWERVSGRGEGGNEMLISYADLEVALKGVRYSKLGRIRCDSSGVDSPFALDVSDVAASFCLRRNWACLALPTLSLLRLQFTESYLSGQL